MATVALQKAAPKKRIIVCCDGTWNNSVSTDNPLTNVSKLSRCIDHIAADGMPQIVYYHTGIGSGTSKLSNFVDATVGRGMPHIVKNVYTFICLNYNSLEDEIFLIGFSRGAYTVLLLSSLITQCGLLNKAGLGQINCLYDRWQKLDSMSDHDRRKSGIQENEYPGLRQFIPIEACAVWDTVSALGLPASLEENALNSYSSYISLFHKLRRTPTVETKAVSSRIKNVFHAVALNEYRGDFKPILWAEPSATTNIRQCWFLGSHSDIGGGYEECWLSNITLFWMVAQLREHTGLTISNECLKQYLCPTGSSIHRDNVFTVHQGDNPTERKSENPDPDIRAGLVNNSFQGVYALGAKGFRAPGGETAKHQPLNQGIDVAPEQELVTVQQTVHSSVRVLMKGTNANCPVMDYRKTEIASSRVIWRRFNREGKVDRLRARQLTFNLHVDDEGELLEDLLCDEEKNLVNVWIETLGDVSDSSTGDNDPASTSVNTQDVVPADPSKAKRPAKTKEQKKKGLYFRQKRSNSPRQLTTREVLNQLIHDADPEGMYSPSKVAKTRIALLLGFSRQAIVL